MNEKGGLGRAKRKRKNIEHSNKTRLFRLVRGPAAPSSRPQRLRARAHDVYGVGQGEDRGLRLARRSLFAQLIPDGNFRSERAVRR